jgi:hypothetical protein
VSAGIGAEREPPEIQADAASHDVGLVFVLRGALEQSGVMEALALAEAVALYRDHPRWAVWLPTAGEG